MRTFIAIELPQEIKSALAQLQEQLKQSGADVKWVQAQNIHLTLKFLGEVDEKRLEKIINILEEVAKNKNPFSLSISSLGAFPKLDYPRIIWLGIDEGDKETKEITKELEEKIAKIGIPKEDRPFSSHITIGRTKSTLNREKLVQNLKTLAGNFGKRNLACRVTKIILFKSTLTLKGPIYEALKEDSFKTI